MSSNTLVRVRKNTLDRVQILEARIRQRMVKILKNANRELVEVVLDANVRLNKALEARSLRQLQELELELLRTAC